MAQNIDRDSELQRNAGHDGGIASRNVGLAPDFQTAGDKYLRQRSAFYREYVQRYLMPWASSSKVSLGLRFGRRARSLMRAQPATMVAGASVLARGRVTQPAGSTLCPSLASSDG
jgi:hypothetical protein